MKMAAKRVQELDEQIKKMDKELKGFKEKEIRQREGVTLMKEEVTDKDRQIRVRDESMAKYTKDINDLHKEVDKLTQAAESLRMESYFKESQVQKELGDKKAEMDRLRQELVLLKTGKVAGFFDRDGKLASSGLGFANAEEIYKKIREWLHLNPSVNLCQLLKVSSLLNSNIITS